MESSNMSDDSCSKRKLDRAELVSSEASKKLCIANLPKVPTADSQADKKFDTTKQCNLQDKQNELTNIVPSSEDSGKALGIISSISNVSLNALSANKDEMKDDNKKEGIKLKLCGKVELKEKEGKSLLTPEDNCVINDKLISCSLDQVISDSISLEQDTSKKIETVVENKITSLPNSVECADEANVKKETVRSITLGLDNLASAKSKLDEEKILGDSYVMKKATTSSQTPSKENMEMQDSIVVPNISSTKSEAISSAAFGVEGCIELMNEDTNIFNNFKGKEVTNKRVKDDVIESVEKKAEIIKSKGDKIHFDKSTSNSKLDLSGKRADEENPLIHLQAEERIENELSFKGKLKNDNCSSLEESTMPSLSLLEEKSNSRRILEPSKSSFEPFSKAVEEMKSAAIGRDNDRDTKSELSTMDVESNFNTPIETPIDSRDTSPTSTPFDSQQLSSALSPCPKDEASNASLIEDLMDDSSMDTRDEEKIERPVRKFGRRGRGRSSGATRRRGRGGRLAPVVVDEETRMSAANGISDIQQDEDSQSSTGATSRRESKKYRLEVTNPESTTTFTADKVLEYLWPLEGLGEHYFIQEHISQYLGIISFKRKYPDLRRRPIESQEKEYLKDLNIVSEIACDLGLTAVRSEDVLDIMFTDFPSKYEELQKDLRERKEKILREKGKVDYQVVDLDKSKMQEYSRKSALNAAKWNASFNRKRNEERRYAIDLQTFTINSPRSRHVKLPASETEMGFYPVAVLPGQYVDRCKKYRYGELLSMPLQTVVEGPYTPDEIAALMNAPDKESDDESAVSASLGSGPEIIKDEVEDVSSLADPMSIQKQLRCKVCSGNRQRNKEGKPEHLIVCGTCRSASHPTCIDLAVVMVDKIESYSWQCMECKTCAQCNDPDDEERMIFCDMCDRGYHIYCVGLRRVPNGRWHCKNCASCFTCGARNPSGTENIKNPEWQHEFKRDKNKELKYMCTLCMPCDKYWKRRQFCTVCLKVYRSIPEDGMVRCSVCPKYVHREKCSVLFENERYCNVCYKNRNKTSLNHTRIIAAAKKKMAIGNITWK